MFVVKIFAGTKRLIDENYRSAFEDTSNGDENR